MNKDFMKSYTLNKVVQTIEFWDDQEFEFRELSAKDFDDLTTVDSQIMMLVIAVMAGTFDLEGKKVFKTQTDREFLLGMKMNDLSEVGKIILDFSAPEEVEEGKSSN